MTTPQPDEPDDEPSDYTDGDPDGDADPSTGGMTAAKAWALIPWRVDR